MNALIVDDDRFVVSALESRIDWASLAIGRVFIASNIRQARAIIESHPVHVMICDIEMPQGSGLELLAWIRETDRNIATIFLTNHALFHYAQKALELQSLDYFLKPISYEKLYPVLQKAVEQAKGLRGARESAQEEKRRFWRAALADANPESACSDAELPPGYARDSCFLLLWIEQFCPIGTSGPPDASIWECEAFEELLDALAAANLPTDGEWGSRQRQAKLLVLRDEGAARPMHDLLVRFLEEVRRQTGADCRAAATRASIALEDVPRAHRRLTEMATETVVRRNGIAYLEDYIPWDGRYAAPDLRLLESNLRAMNLKGFLAEMHKYLVAQGDMPSARMLGLVHIDVFQLFLALLSENNIEAHRLFSGELHEELSRRHMDSLEDFVAHIEHLAASVIRQIDLTALPESVINVIVQYIDNNIDKPLTRQSLSERVFLNPDYLARVFKRAMGVSLGQYIKTKRIDFAKKLLLETNLPMWDIAAQAGYGSTSYFAVTFQKLTGKTPHAFRYGGAPPRPASVD